MAKHQEIPTLNTCLRARIVLAVIIFLAVVTSPSKSYSATEKNNMIGIRSGILALDRDEFFYEYEVFISRRLTSPTPIPLGRTLSIFLDGAYGSLNAGGITGVNLILGPTFQIGIIERTLSLNIGTSAAFISQSHFGNENLGGHLQFVSHAGFIVRLDEEIGVTYRFQHMSNASLSHPNPGVDLHAIGVGYYF